MMTSSSPYLYGNAARYVADHPKASFNPKGFLRYVGNIPYVDPLGSRQCLRGFRGLLSMAACYRAADMESFHPQTCTPTNGRP